MRTEKPIIDLNKTRKLFIEHRETIRAVINRAVQQALLEHKRAGNPIAVSENGEVVWIAPEDINASQQTV